MVLFTFTVYLYVIVSIMAAFAWRAIPGTSQLKCFPSVSSLLHGGRSSKRQRPFKNKPRDDDDDDVADGKQIDDELFGLREAVVTRAVRPDCVSTAPCLRSPCVDDAQCVDDGLDGFRLSLIHI